MVDILSKIVHELIAGVALYFIVVTTLYFIHGRGGFPLENLFISLVYVIAIRVYRNLSVKDGSE